MLCPCDFRFCPGKEKTVKQQITSLLAIWEIPEDQFIEDNLLTRANITSQVTIYLFQHHPLIVSPILNYCIMNFAQPPLPVHLERLEFRLLSLLNPSPLLSYS